MTRVPLSALDLAVVADGASSTDALAATLRITRKAEELGFVRLWVAEHHNMPTVASTTPSVLIAHLAANTERIRIGSGGVMLPNHAPLAIAEQFALLEALHPGRIDLGLGRAPGTDPNTAAALRRTNVIDADDFPNDLLDLMGLLGQVRTTDGMWKRFRATPHAETSPLIALLGSSGYSARLAGLLGLPFGYAHHFDTGGTLQAFRIYRESFEPSPVLDAPHAIVTANVLVAPTDDEADELANPGRLMMHAIRTGRPRSLPSPADALADPNLAAARAMPTNRVVGSPATAVAALDDLIAQTDANELMISSVAFDVDDRCRSLELLASAWRSPVGARPSASAWATS
jgi:luciferase family oxidoreductase group 1